MDDRTPLLIPVDKLVEFQPEELGALGPKFKQIATSLDGKLPSQIRELLKREVQNCGQDTPSAKAFRATLLILRDYIDSGYYPLLQGEDIVLAPLLEAGNVGESQRREALRTLYRQARTNALRIPGQRKSFERLLGTLAKSQYRSQECIAALADGPPELQLTVAGQGAGRALWRAVRATWSMTPDASAPGREVSVVLEDRKFPGTPLGVAQFRNVVPEIRCRDSWLGLTSRNAEGGPGGFVDRLGDVSDAKDRISATAQVLTSLLGAVNPDGLPSINPSGGKQQAEGLQKLAARFRDAYNDARKSDERDLARQLLAQTKRAETAAELSLGLAGLSACLDSSNPAQFLREDVLMRRLVDSGLRKIWHYHMGFVALEMSVCGAAPPFGPMRAGKLAAAVAGSETVLEAWGRDRPLGQIAATVYKPEVREKIPNPGPLVVFTSGLYPGHSSQYNRASSGGRRWIRIGETRGFGSFHVAGDTIDAIDEYNIAADGYSHITRTFGEGASARFRAIGKALSGLGLPDLRRHDTRRPMYALPLVNDPGGVLLGWEPAGDVSGATAIDLSKQWWDRWVSARGGLLAEQARCTPDLIDELAGMMREVGPAPNEPEQLTLAF
ncbi:Druantia anti-phage system protein DruA [Streptomyces sp. V1I1]|uniref:Druantia anti-phage system protein DruA n=1 Tax=Streptomyces sp. V1I1 TaxID=3042272 RepID=UPI0027D84303|nr:Druantia anti-phage system protein DruA [Streptomyces sp. V1I1]